MTWKAINRGEIHRGLRQGKIQGKYADDTDFQQQLARTPTKGNQ